MNVNKEGKVQLTEPPKNFASRRGLHEQCWYMANAACQALGLDFEHTSPQDIFDGLTLEHELIEELLSKAKFGIAIWKQGKEYLAATLREDGRAHQRSACSPSFFGRTALADLLDIVNKENTQ
jgi:hypothetical protein